jgi:hypothetical protein
VQESTLAAGKHIILPEIILVGSAFFQSYKKNKNQLNQLVGIRL